MTNDDSSNRLESAYTTPLLGRSDQHATSGSSDTPRDRPSTLVHSIAHEAKYLKGASITRDDVTAKTLVRLGLKTAAISRLL